MIDECHRGSAADDAAWRQILEYFSSATQIGLTATPKETKEISNTEYFGDPIYTYSLKQGISDGFLAPYKVVRIGLDKDLEGWRPEKGKTDKYGQEIENREYNQTDFDRNLVLEKRTALVAAKVTEFLKATNRFAKTIIFCENIDHAERMRQALVNANADLAAANPRYVMRITGDNDEGKAQLDNFIDPESTFPVIACTSRLMSTGVDAQTCHLIVLDRRIASMTEFKQIIGRGTRINEDYNKLYFTIMDFRRATALFTDPDFDGEPVQIYEPKGAESVVPLDDTPAPCVEEEQDRYVGADDMAIDENSPGSPPETVRRRRRRNPRRHRARSISRRTRQTHHRVAQRLFPQNSQKNLRFPRRVASKIRRQRYHECGVIGDSQGGPAHRPRHTRGDRQIFRRPRRLSLRHPRARNGPLPKSFLIPERMKEDAPLFRDREAPHSLFGNGSARLRTRNLGGRAGPEPRGPRNCFPATKLASLRCECDRRPAFFTTISKKV